MTPTIPGLGPWQNVYRDPATAAAIAQRIGGIVVPRDPQNFDVFYSLRPKPPLPTMAPAVTPVPAMKQGMGPSPAAGAVSPAGLAIGQPAITPLQIDQLTRDTYSEFDAVVIAQLAGLAFEPCYKPKLYKAPDSAQEVIAAGSRVTFGLSITPGSLIYGFYGSDTSGYLVQVRDMNLELDMFREPVPIGLINNSVKTTGYPWLLNSPHPSTGTGQFQVKIWNNSAAQARIQVVLGVLEVVSCVPQT